jgi:hypothetical protein
MSDTLMEILKIDDSNIDSFIEALCVSDGKGQHFVLHRREVNDSQIKHYKIEFPTNDALMNSMHSPNPNEWRETDALCEYMISPDALMSAYHNYLKKENTHHT